MNFGILMVQGSGQQLRHGHHGGLCGGGEDRFLCLYAGAGFWQRILDLCGPELRGRPAGPHQKGIRSAGLTSAVFCIVISVLVCAFAAPLMGIFIDPAQTEIIAAGVQYLRIEGACYIGIGVLFLLYGYYRAVNQPGMSVILTIASLGTRVALAYLLSATPLGVTGIWLSVPIGWALADAIGIGYYLKKRT